METSEGLTMEYLTPSLLLCSLGKFYKVKAKIVFLNFRIITIACPLLATTSAAIVATALWKAMKPIKRKMKNKEDYFDDINANLQNDLRNKLLGKINEVKQEIKFKTLQKEKNVKHLLKQQQDEIAIKQSQFMIEKFEIESRYKEKLELLEKEVVDDINHLKDSLKDLSIILANAGPGESGDMVTSARSELECPVCLEEMRPPKRYICVRV